MRISRNGLNHLNIIAAHLEFVYMIGDFEDGADKYHAGLTEDDWSVQLTFDYKF